MKKISRFQRLTGHSTLFESTANLKKIFRVRDLTGHNALFESTTAAGAVRAARRFYAPHAKLVKPFATNVTAFYIGDRPQQTFRH